MDKTNPTLEVKRSSTFDVKNLIESIQAQPSLTRSNKEFLTELVKEMYSFAENRDFTAFDTLDFVKAIKESKSVLALKLEKITKPGRKVKASIDKLESFVEVETTKQTVDVEGSARKIQKTLISINFSQSTEMSEVSVSDEYQTKNTNLFNSANEILQSNSTQLQHERTDNRNFIQYERLLVSLLAEVVPLVPIRNKADRQTYTDKQHVLHWNGDPAATVQVNTSLDVVCMTDMITWCYLLGDVIEKVMYDYRTTGIMPKNTFYVDMNRISLQRGVSAHKTNRKGTHKIIQRLNDTSYNVDVRNSNLASILHAISKWSSEHFEELDPNVISDQVSEFSISKLAFITELDTTWAPGSLSGDPEARDPLTIRYSLHTYTYATICNFVEGMVNSNKQDKIKSSNSSFIYRLSKSFTQEKAKLTDQMFAFRFKLILFLNKYVERSQPKQFGWRSLKSEFATNLEEKTFFELFYSFLIDQATDLSLELANLNRDQLSSLSRPQKLNEFTKLEFTFENFKIKVSTNGIYVEQAETIDKHLETQFNSAGQGILIG